MDYGLFIKKNKMGRECRLKREANFLWANSESTWKCPVHRLQQQKIKSRSLNHLIFKI